MRSLLLLTIAVVAHPSLEAQTPAESAPTALRAATEALNTRLGMTHLRGLSCVTPDFANCVGGVEVVQAFHLGAAVLQGDTVSVPVGLEVLGVVASSEAELMFLPDRTELHLDSATVRMRRRGTRWVLDTLGVLSGSPLTSAASARAFFQFEADDRRLFDSTAAARRMTPAQPPDER